MDQKLERKSNRRDLLRNIAVLGAAAGASMHSTVKATSGPRVQHTTAYVDHGELTIALTTGDLQAIQPLLDEYTLKTGTTIKPVVDSYSNIYTKISISLTQSTGAFDIVSLDDPWMPQFAEGKFLVDLSERMEKDGVKSDPDFMQELLRLGRYPNNSALHGLPWVGNIQLFAWRQDVLDQLEATPPVTWDDVLTLASQISSEGHASGLFGFGLRGKAGNAAATSFLPLLRGYGKDLIDPATNEPQLDSDEAIQAMTMFLSLKDLAPPGAENTAHLENGMNLTAGIIGLSADIWPDQLYGASDPSKSSVAGLVSFGPEPAQKGIRRSNVTGAWLLGIAQGSKSAERAADFVYWFTAVDQQKKLLMNSYVSPTRSSVMADPDALEKFPFLTEIMESIKRSMPRLRTPFYRAMEETCGRYVAEAVAGRTSAEEAMLSANSEIRALLVREGLLT